MELQSTILLVFFVVMCLSSRCINRFHEAVFEHDNCNKFILSLFKTLEEVQSNQKITMSIEHAKSETRISRILCEDKTM